MKNDFENGKREASRTPEKLFRERALIPYDAQESQLLVETPGPNKLMAKSLSDDRRASPITNQKTRIVKPSCIGNLKMQTSAAVPKVMSQADWARFSLQERSKLNQLSARR